jgi:hypothetical protein
MLNAVFLFRSSFPDMSLIPMGPFDWASNSEIAKHPSVAGTLLNTGLMMEFKVVLYSERQFNISNNMMFVKREKPST